ncbi:hypothetical protein GGX14DRAFT_561125 [Mycena pura]|uniref:Uncharacterized protein n=1 Tax=Mycena pura TaxID=153505 RepID=A0AAD6VMM0_9AGAR|nr:hypothetical protein GGX14DRAFT_561125 [Mycena pura]
MSIATDSLHIQHLQAIPPALYFLVPLASVLLFFLAVSRADVRPRHDPTIVNIQLRRVVWVFPVVFSLALLSILAGALLFSRQRSTSFSLAMTDSVVSSVLYLKLCFSAMYLLSVVTTLASIHPAKFFFYCIVLATILISATMVSIAGSFEPIPPLVPPILYLCMTVLTVPVTTFSLLTAMDRSEVFLAPRINVSPTYSFPRLSTEKSRSFDDVPPTLEMRLPERAARAPAARNISIYILCGQISASVHFALWISILVYLPDQSSPAPTLTGEEVAAGVSTEAFVFRIVQTVFLVFWIICTMSALLQLYSRSGSGCHGVGVRSSTFTTASEATITAFTALPARSSRRGPRIKYMSISRSSSFSSPRPRRQPVDHDRDPPADVPRRPSPLDDFQNLRDPFAPPPAYLRTSEATASTGTVDDPDAKWQRPTRMSAWGTLPPIASPRPPPNVLVLNPSTRAHARRLPPLHRLGLRVGGRAATGADGASTLHSASTGEGKETRKGKRRSRSILTAYTGYTSPSAYSQDGEGDMGFDMDEALLAQTLLRRLDAAAVPGRSDASSGRKWVRRPGL